MATPTKKTATQARASKAGAAVVYRGIKLAPVTGRRSATATAIRDALRARHSEKSCGESARA